MIIDKASGLALGHQNDSAQTALKKILTKLATGKRINAASDDAAMMSIAEELEKQVRGFQQAESNIGDALSALQISDGAASSINDLMQRQRELAIRASNGTIGQSGRDAINAEFQQLTREIDRISLSAQYNSQRLLDGSTGSLSDGNAQIQVGTGTGEGDSVKLPSQDLRAATIGVSNLNLTSRENISAAITGLDSAMQQVNQTRTRAGAAYNRLEYAQNNAANTRINTTDALSRAEDLDYAQGVAEQARISLLSQTNLAAMSNFNEISKNNILSLLRQ